MRRIAALLCLTGIAGCSGARVDAADGAEERDSIATCPTNDPATRDVLASLPALAATCDGVAPPPAQPLRAWNRPTTSTLITGFESNHRGRDVIYTPDDVQWVLGKFAYGLVDKDLKGEDVDVFLLRGCAGAWEYLGTSTTTFDGDHESEEGVDDTGGRVFFQIPDDKRLAVGRHRIHMVVAGDGTTADLSIEVLPKGTPIFVSDVDGTLTERQADDSEYVCDEESDFPALWRGIYDGEDEPLVHVGAPDALTALAMHGYRPMYLTARPEWLVPHTRAFLDESARNDGRGNLPHGVVHTTLGLTGAFDSAAQAFKEGELQALRNKGFVPTLGFGNRQSDIATYDLIGIPYRYYFQNNDTTERDCNSQVLSLPVVPSDSAIKTGDWRLLSYSSLVPSFSTAPAPCQ